MQIKCPGCSKVLNIPDTAAGRVVQCPCGKQLRAPGGSPAVAASAPAAQPMGAAPARVARPQQPTAPIGGGFGLDDDLFSELTDTDMSGIAAVARPGVPQKAVAAAPSAMLKQYAGEDTNAKKALKPGQRPGTLTFLGVLNILGALLMGGIIALVVGVAAMLQIDPAILLGGMADATIAFIVATVVFWFILHTGVAISCFVPSWFTWQVLIFGYAFMTSYRVLDITWSIMTEGFVLGRFFQMMMYLIASICFWAYAHQDESRKFYQVGPLKAPQVLAANILGVLFGIGFGIMPFFLTIE
ncbi:zinc-ribbon domain-containing protein [Stieleria varia]|nr:zinc-ribbon domain-containing protein [Stieleria varia]